MQVQVAVDFADCRYNVHNYIYLAMYVHGYDPFVSTAIIILIRFDMMESTWQDEPEKRPTFVDIVHFFHNQNIKDGRTQVDHARNIIVGTKKDSGYLKLSN